jgi:hypothetical protein
MNQLRPYVHYRQQIVVNYNLKIHLLGVIKYYNLIHCFILICTVWMKKMS